MIYQQKNKKQDPIRVHRNKDSKIMKSEELAGM